MAEVLDKVKAAEERGFEKGVESERARSEDTLAAAQAASDAKLAEAEAKLLVVAERSGAEEASRKAVRTVTPVKTPSQLETSQKVTVMSWNIANFTHNKSNDADKVYRDKRYELLTERLVKTRPTVLFVQEVQNRGGGEEAMKTLKERLNEKLAEREKLGGECYDFVVSLDLSSGKERYGVLWDTNMLGKEKPELELWRLPMKYAPPFDLCTSDHKALKAARRYAKNFCGGSHFQFARAPLFVRFTNSIVFTLRDVVFCTVHLDTGQEKKGQPTNQYRLEALFLQAVLVAGATSERKRKLLLCGDINEDEAKKYSKTLGNAELWKPRDPSMEVDEWHRLAGFSPQVLRESKTAKKCCDLIRQPFFDAFARVFNDVVTNVFPLVKDAALNDNIFVSNGLSFGDPLVGTLDILAPNLISGMRREAKNAAIREMKTRDDKCLHYAKKIYSDHVDVSISLTTLEARSLELDRMLEGAEESKEG